MNQKIYHNLAWIPLFLLGLGAVGLGIGWLIHPEPWLLDQPPNEALLNMSFRQLFEADINANLPDYLRVIYRFFGWWILSIGLLTMTYVQITRMGTALARQSILCVLTVILIGVSYMVYSFIPLSPFKAVLYIQWALIIVSFYGSKNLK